MSEIKAYVQGEKSKIIENFSTTQKQALNKLMNKMEAKVKEWKAEKSKSENNNPSQENPAWYKTWYGILGIIAVIVLALGLIAYFVKSNSSEEGEEENE